MALEVIQQAMPLSRNGVVFPNQKGGMTVVNVLDKVMSRYGWRTDDKPTPHDLRRTCITGLGALGFTRFVQNTVANHADGSIGGIYDRYAYLKEKRQALEAWGLRLTEIVTGESVEGEVVEFRRT
jgi:integrase